MTKLTKSIAPQTYIWLFVGLLMLGLAGCSSAPVVDPSIVTTYKAEPAIDKARVTFYRKGNAVGFEFYYSVFANGQFIGKLRNGTYFTREFTPGKYVFETDAEFGKTNRLPVNLNAGGDFYIEGIMIPGVLAGRGKLLLSKKEHATEYIQNSLHAKESDK